MSFMSSNRVADAVAAALAALTKASVGLGNVDDTSDASKPVSAAQQAALAAKAPIAGTPTAPTFAFPSGTYVAPLLVSSTALSAADSLRLAPCFIPQTLTITRFVGEVTTAGSSGSKMRLGIFADTGAGMPGALVLDAGQINGDSATVQEITLGSSLVLTPGWYWVGAAAQSATPTAPTCRVVASSGPVGGAGSGFLMNLGTTLPVAGVAAAGLAMTGVTGALPSTFNNNGGAVGSVPRILFKLA